jgi:hypothetical protein
LTFIIYAHLTFSLYSISAFNTQGDYGGAVTISTSNKLTQTAIIEVQQSAFTCRKGPVIALRISAIADWIHSVTGQDAESSTQPTTTTTQPTTSTQQKNKKNKKKVSWNTFISSILKKIFF